MRRLPRPKGGAILFGMLATSIALYWAADTGSAVIQGLLIGLLCYFVVVAIWPSK